VQPEIINKLEEKAAAMLRDRQLIAQASADEDSANSPEKLALAGYASLVKDSNVPVGIRYLALHSIAGKHKFYDDSRDQPQMLGTVAEAMGNLQPGAVVKSIQYIKTEYPSIYQLEQGIFDRYEAHAVGFMTRLPVDRQDKTVAEGKDTQLNPIPVVVEPPPVSPPPPPVVPPIPPSIPAESRYEPAISQVYQSTTNTTLKPDPALNQNSNKGAFIIGGAMISGAIIFSALLLSQQPKQGTTIGGNVAPVGTSVPSASFSNRISQNEAEKVIQEWLQAKNRLFAPPYDQQFGESLMTGKALKDNIRGPSTDGEAESSLEWLRNRGKYWKYGVQRINSVKNFISDDRAAVITVDVTEERTLYNRSGDVEKKSDTSKSSLTSYTLERSDGRIKISDFK
jgi:hypothetical protein